MATLGEIIKKYRYSKTPKVTLDELARKSGISKSYLSMTENNNFPRGKEIKPTGETLLKLAEAMEMSIDYLCNQLDDDIRIVVKTHGTPISNDKGGEDAIAEVTNTSKANDEMVQRALAYYKRIQSASPEVQAAIETLLKASQSDSEHPQ